MIGDLGKESSPISESEFGGSESNLLARDLSHMLLSLFFFFFFVFYLFRATPTAYGDLQARGQIGAAAAGLCHSHSNAGSEPRLRPTPQLTAMTDP